MKKLAYSIISSTGLVVAAFAPHHGDKLAGVFFAITFGVACLATNEK